MSPVVGEAPDECITRTRGVDRINRTSIDVGRAAFVDPHGTLSAEGHDYVANTDVEEHLSSLQHIVHVVDGHP